MFVRWQSRKHTVRRSWLGGPDDVHWRADLVASERVDGKPRQKHLLYLVGFTEAQVAIEAQRFFIWESALKRLDMLTWYEPRDRQRIEAAVAKRIGMPAPAREELEAFHVRNRADLEELAAAFHRSAIVAPSAPVDAPSFAP
jgi:hypothetical protein